MIISGASRRLSDEEDVAKIASMVKVDAFPDESGREAPIWPDASRPR
jgi:hypothetical protein